MELRQLKYFKAACELQNFSEAARALYISQSTLSQQIKQLEDELEVLLFDRIGKRIVPTEAGLAFLPYANKALQDAEDGKQILRDLKGIKIGNLHVGVTYSMGPVLVSALEPFTKVYPNIRLRITFGTSEELLHLLEITDWISCFLSSLKESATDLSAYLFFSRGFILLYTSLIRFLLFLPSH